MIPAERVLLGTRGSPLALQQAHWVKDRLEQHHPELKVDLVTIKTKGDKILDVPLAQVGGKGLFVKEIEEALLSKKVDLAVHSMKDMPGDLPEGLRIGAVPVREDPRDVFLSRIKSPWTRFRPRPKSAPESAPQGPAPGVSAGSGNYSLEGQPGYPDSKDGNPGIGRDCPGSGRAPSSGMGPFDRPLPGTRSLFPAVGQGALAIEVRADDFRLQEWIAFLHHEESALCTRAERAFLHRLEGGCQVPLAGQARVQGERLVLAGLIADLEGKICSRIKGKARSMTPKAWVRPWPTICWG